MPKSRSNSQHIFLILLEFKTISFWHIVMFKLFNSLISILSKFVILYKLIYLKFWISLNTPLEVSILDKIKLDMSRANNSWHPLNKLLTLVTKEESKWLKSIDIIAWAFSSIFVSKKFSKLVT